jgi:hypothetical protein
VRACSPAISTQQATALVEISRGSDQSASTTSEASSASGA